MEHQAGREGREDKWKEKSYEKGQREEEKEQKE
jgi:hypothetical protein